MAARQKRWEDNIKERTGMDFASSTSAAENRTWWKGTVANLCGAPMTFQGYGIELKVTEVNIFYYFYDIRFYM